MRKSPKYQLLNLFKIFKSILQEFLLNKEIQHLKQGLYLQREACRATKNKVQMNLQAQ